MKREEAGRVARWALVTGVVVLAGCARGGADTAWQLIEQQRQEQQLVRQHEAETARRQVADKPELMRSLIRETQAQGRYFASLAYIDAYQQQFGSHPDLDGFKARALRLTGQVQESEAVYRDLLKGNRAAEGWHGLGLLAGARGDYEQAAQDLGRAASLTPTDPDILNDLGYARLRAGDAAGARLPLGQAAELAPDNNRILANLALLLLVEGQAVRAQQLMDRAGLGPEARNQIYRLASDVQAVHAIPVRAAHSGDYIGPTLEPVLERFGNPRLIP